MAPVPRSGGRRASEGSEGPRDPAVSGEDAAPVDRPNLSKDYLAGTAPEDWVPLRPDGFYGENGIEQSCGSIDAITAIPPKKPE